MDVSIYTVAEEADSTPVFCCVNSSGVLAAGHPTPFFPVKFCSVINIAVARVCWVAVSVTAGLLLKVIGVPRTLPAATLVCSLAMKAARDGGQTAGMATPFSPLPEPVAMLKTGTRVGLMAALAAAARVSMRESSRSVMGRAEVLMAKREMAARVLRNCMLTDVCCEKWGMFCDVPWVYIKQ
jgi:hypothetical protein